MEKRHYHSLPAALLAIALSSTASAAEAAPPAGTASVKANDADARVQLTAPEAVSNFSTGDLWDANHDSAAMIPIEWRSYGGIRRFAGRIATMRTQNDHAAIRAMVKSPGEGRVLVIDSGGQRQIGMLGEEMATLAAQHGWAGVVISGPVRDSEALRLLKIGILALGTTAMRSFSNSAVHEQDVPVTLGGVTLKPGDWIYVDADAVLVSPKRLELNAAK